MDSVFICFQDISEIQKFVYDIKDFAGDIDLIQGRHVVDAKSILGICSLDMQSPMEMLIHSDDCDALKEIVKDFIV